MANKQVDIHRSALALVQASRAEDTDAVFAVLKMVRDDPDADGDEFLAALGNMVHYAYACNPAYGWEAFVETYAASLDEVEAKLSRKTDT